MNTIPVTLVSLSLLLFSACGSADSPPEVAEEPVVMEEVGEVIVHPIEITEHRIGPVHMNSAMHELGRLGGDLSTVEQEEPYKTVAMIDMMEKFKKEEVLPMEPHEVPLPLGPHWVVSEKVEMDVVSKVVAFEKNGVEVMQVSYDQMDPEHVEHVVFMHKGHVDEYDVHPGMKGKEARKLRKELRHVQHKGQVFLVDEQSNITYRMRATELNKGEEVTIDAVDRMEVEAIVWSNKHHKHRKNPKKQAA